MVVRTITAKPPRVFRCMHSKTNMEKHTSATWDSSVGTPFHIPELYMDTGLIKGNIPFLALCVGSWVSSLR